MTDTVSPNATLTQAKAWLRPRIYDPNGATCPCCLQRAAMRERPLSKTMARALIGLYQLQLGAEPTAFFHVTEVARRASVDAHGCELSKTRHWGLIEEERTLRPDGGRAGFWRLTDAGRSFVEARSTITSHIKLYNSRFWGLTGSQVDIHHCLTEAFDLRVLMTGSSPSGERPL